MREVDQHGRARDRRDDHAAAGDAQASHGGIASLRGPVLRLRLGHDI